MKTPTELAHLATYQRSAESAAFPMDQGPELSDCIMWEAPRRHRRGRGPSTLTRLKDGAKKCWSAMLHGVDRQNRDASWWSEFVQEAPAWLVSVVVHFLLVVVLGLFAVGVQKQIADMKVEAAPAYGFSENDLGESLGSGLDEGAPGPLSEDFNPLLPSALSVSDTPTDSNELNSPLASVDADWQELITADDGNPALLSGAGDSPFGGGTGGGNGGGGNGVTSVFGLSGEGGKFVYVFDRSESMNSVFTLYSKQQILSSITPLRSAKLELIRSLNNLSGGNRFQIVFYNDDPRLFGTQSYGHELYAANEENKKLAIEYIETMKAEGFTNHLLALDAALQLEPDVIFLMTDGEAKDDLLPAQVRRLYKYCRHRKIVINVVHFCNTPREECTLVRLAEKTGGQHLFIKLEDLAEDMIEPKKVIEE